MFVFADRLMLLSPSRDGYWESNKNCYTQPKPKRGFKMTKINVCVFNLLSSERAFQVRIFPHRIIATFHSRQPYCISKTIFFFCFVFLACNFTIFSLAAFTALFSRTVV